MNVNFGKFKLFISCLLSNVHLRVIRNTTILVAIIAEFSLTALTNK